MLLSAIPAPLASLVGSETTHHTNRVLGCHESLTKPEC